MKLFNHIDAGTTDEAIALMKKNAGRAKIMAGGTDLLGVLKGDILPEYPELLINIKTIPGLSNINKKDNILNIGALTTLAEIAENPLISSSAKALSSAALSVATTELRNMGTIGGNLCQEVRCMYYRYPHQIGGRLLCRRKGGKQCLAIKGDNRYHAITGGDKCFAVCPSDTAVALTALDAKLNIKGPSGEREIAVQDFYSPLGIKLEHGEILTDIQIPFPEKDVKQEFVKFTVRKPIDFAVISIAAAITIESGKCINARIALGGIAPAPVRAIPAEQIIIGKNIDEKIAASAAEAAINDARPLSMNFYKIELTKSLIKKTLLSIFKETYSR